MRKIDEYNTTTNSSVYKKIRREFLANGVIEDSHITCPICPPHQGCNIWHKKRKGRKQKNRKRDKRK